MELYKIIATIKNTTPDTVFELAWIPENFEGVKISQSFSFVPPIGFNPKFSVDTMRVLNEDKWALDDVFDEFGLESDVTFLIKKLNVNGFAYDDLATFAIDFTSYEKFDFYSEFALKSVSVIDYYNKKKNVLTSYLIPSDFNKYIPNTIKFVNYVSLKSKGYYETNKAYFSFDANNEIKLYDNDSVFYTPEPTATDLDTFIYTFGAGTPSTSINIRLSASINMKFSGSNKTGVSLILYKVKIGASMTPIYTFFTTNITTSGTNVIVSIPETSINLGICDDGDSLMIATNIITDAVIESDSFFDIKKMTNIFVLKSTTNSINVIGLADILENIFNNNVTFYDYNKFSDKCITSANQIVNSSNYIELKPSELIADMCKIMGLIFNFKNNGTARFDSIDNYFNTLLSDSNAIEITDFKDLSVKYSSDLSLNSIVVGQDSKKYTNYPYILNWVKKISFIQDRNCIEELNLSLNNFRVDFAGVIDYLVMRSKQEKTNEKDNFILDVYSTEITASNEWQKIYDTSNSRDMLVKWKKFLSFAFQNFGKNTLTLSSNGGTSDNLTISGVSQMDNLVLNETPRLLPIEYNFTCLIDDVDFSENILKINHEGADVYLFVINAETTDNLSEQEIRALKIQLT